MTCELPGGTYIDLRPAHPMMMMMLSLQQQHELRGSNKVNVTLVCTTIPVT